MTTLDPLQTILGHQFKQPALLAQAVTHVSATLSKRPKPPHYERLEFLGDRVLNLICAELLYKAFPKEKEGQIARRHAALVQGKTIAGVMHKLELEQYIRVNKDTSINDALLADVGEAMIAALYLDGGFEVAAQFVKAHWQPLLEAVIKAPKDAKSKLQEWAQRRGIDLPTYTVISNAGPDHLPQFTVEVQVGGQPPARATAASKKQAERAAAAMAVAQLYE